MIIYTTMVGVDIQGVSNMMEEVSRRNKEIFSLPTYVLYVIRAFSTLEGDDDDDYDDDDN